jgi:Uma2 family endonuclease
VSEHNGRIPDLAVTRSPLVVGQAMLPDPVLLIEILSPSNQAKTWTNVWAYTSIPSVREILVLRADRIAAELLRRSPQGEWPDRPMAITEGDLALVSIGFRLALADLYAQTGLGS